eukprot:Pgem_evm2s1356
MFNISTTSTLSKYNREAIDLLNEYAKQPRHKNCILTYEKDSYWFYSPCNSESNVDIESAKLSSTFEAKLLLDNNNANLIYLISKPNSILHVITESGLQFGVINDGICKLIINRSVLTIPSVIQNYDRCFSTSDIRILNVNLNIDADPIATSTSQSQSLSRAQSGSSIDPEQIEILLKLTQNDLSIIEKVPLLLKYKQKLEVTKTK